MRRFLLIIVGMFLLMPLAAKADTIQAIALGCHTISSFSTAQNLPTIDAGATFIVASIENNAVRYRDDKTAPTANVGVEVQIGNLYYSGPLVLLQFIPVTGSAVINYCDYR